MDKNSIKNVNRLTLSMPSRRCIKRQTQVRWKFAQTHEESVACVVSEQNEMINDNETKYLAKWVHETRTKKMLRKWNTQRISYFVRKHNWRGLGRAEVYGERLMYGCACAWKSTEILYDSGLWLYCRFMWMLVLIIHDAVVTVASSLWQTED